MSAEFRNPLADFFADDGVAILDGAMATELEARSANIDDPLWSAKALIDSPDTICQVHYDYYRAGADIATTASYQATLPGFRNRGISDEEGEELILKSVAAARAARDEFWDRPENHKGRQRPLVAGSAGPYGAYLADGSEYRGDYGLTKNQLIDFHRPRIEILAEGGVDFILCETIPCAIEAEALVDLFHEYPDLPACISFTCRDTTHTAGGDAFTDCIAIAADPPSVLAVGLNCTHPAYVLPLLQAAAEVTEKPLIAYPNSGETWNAKTKQWIDDSGQPNFPSLAKEWYIAGAQLIGGCCRTTPKIIRQIRAELAPAAGRGAENG